jgi:glycerol 2-dehydrogenase (NADP+)
LQRGTSVIPKSVNPTRIEQNFDLNEWSLSPEEMEKLNGLNVRFKVVNDSWMPIKVFFDDD